MKTITSVIALLLFLVLPVYADQVTVGALTMDWSGAGSIAFSCDSGFQFSGTVGADDGIFPALRLDPTTSAPGMTVDVSGYWTGLAVRGTTIDEQGSLDVGLVDRDDSGDLRFSAFFVAPESGTDVTLDVPFGFRSQFLLRNQTRTIEGFGRAIVFLTMFPGDAQTQRYWDFRSVSYSFTPSTNLTENPEPATMVLSLTGLGLAWYRRRAQNLKR